LPIGDLGQGRCGTVIVGPPGIVMVDGSGGRFGRWGGCFVGCGAGGWLLGGLAGGAAVVEGSVMVDSVVVGSVVDVGSVEVVEVDGVVVVVVDVDVVLVAGPVLLPPPINSDTP
jgi:hypothetical protein